MFLPASFFSSAYVFISIPVQKNFFHNNFFVLHISYRILETCEKSIFEKGNYGRLNSSNYK